MNKIKVACIAGTPFDTKLGGDLLKTEGYEVFLFPSSKNPTEETLFQISSQENKDNKILSILNEIKKQNIDRVFVYCNSLSSAVDFKLFSLKTNLKIITPYDVYENIANGYNSIAVLSANAVASSKLEKVFMQSNNNIKIVSIGMLPLVWSIESGIKDIGIIEKYKLNDLCHWLYNNSFEALLFGCTHFSYIFKELSNISKIPIIDPTLKMLDLLKNC